MAGPLDSPRVGPVPALRVEVLLPGDVGLDRGAEVFCLLRGKGRRADGPADDADGAGEADPVRVDVGFGGGLADQRADRMVSQQVAG